MSGVALNKREQPEKKNSMISLWFRVNKIKIYSAKEKKLNERTKSVNKKEKENQNTINAKGESRKQKR